MINRNEIIETIQMIDAQNLDVRTITMALSLFDCIDADKKKCADKVYEKIVRRAGKLVETGEEIAAEYGVPIVNKRVSVTPISLIGASGGGYIELAKALDRAAKTTGIDFIGGYSALVQKDTAPYEQNFLETIDEAIAITEKVCCSVNVASTKSGMNLDAIDVMGRKLKELAVKTDSFGCGKVVVFANAVEDNPSRGE